MKYAFRLSCLLITGITFLFGEQPFHRLSASPENTNPAQETLQEPPQPYTITKVPVVEDTYPGSMLMIVSLPPTESEYFSSYVDKFQYLKDIITSHWDITIDITDIDSYQLDMIKDYDSVFVAEEFNRPPNTTLIDDLLESRTRQIIWSGFGAGAFSAAVLGQTWPPEKESAIHGSLEYKGVEFSNSNSHLLSSLPAIDSDPNQAMYILATYLDESNQRQPLAIDIDQRYLILPFELPADYELDSISTIFLGALHEALGHHAENRRALLRLEDINAYTYSNNNELAEVYDYLKIGQTPFHIALIERYINPDAGVDLEIGQDSQFFDLLQRMQAEGLGTIVQHGYTHQTADSISGIGYEFWDEEESAPLANDSVAYVTNRIAEVQQAMRSHQIPVPDIWETPHYTLSDLDSQVVNSLYPIRYEHIPQVGNLPFPVQIENTIYIPENMEFILDPDKDIPQILRLLEQISVIDAPVASFFWHPWRDPEELQFLVDLFKERGFEFVSVYDLLENGHRSEKYREIEAWRASYTSSIPYLVRHQWRDYLIAPFYLIFAIGSLVFLRNRYHILKYLKATRTDPPTIDQLQQIARGTAQTLPNIAILVPARNEGFVIGNTVRRLVALDYPRAHFRICVIVDEREQDDNVEILTRDAVQQVAAEFKSNDLPGFIQVIEVPKWYSGEFLTLTKTYEKSTKGRALNYALQHLFIFDPFWDDLDFIGVLDADGRLHRNVLKEAAWKWLTEGSRLMQGPVFQVSNFSQVSLVGVAAGLELAIHHLTELPRRLTRKRLQFLAGTNYFVHKDIMTKVGGWNQKALVEDAELALRIYVKTRCTAEWLNMPELEQTPPNFAVYRRQRERWVRGHFDLLKDIYHARIPLGDKVNFLNLILISQFRFVVDVGLPIVALILMLLGGFGGVGPVFSFASLFLLLFAVAMWDSYGFMYRQLAGHIDSDMPRMARFVQSMKLFVFVPVFMVIQAVPRIQALNKYVRGAGQGHWYKTERTRETPLLVPVPVRYDSGQD